MDAIYVRNDYHAHIVVLGYEILGLKTYTFDKKIKVWVAKIRKLTRY